MRLKTLLAIFIFNISLFQAQALPILVNDDMPWTFQTHSRVAAILCINSVQGML